MDTAVPFSAEHALYEYMFVNKSYLTFVRPVESSNNAVQVNFDLSHVTLVNLVRIS